jgi:acetyl-CoA C-acetyltransferase
MIVPVSIRFFAKQINRTNVVIVGGKRTAFGSFMGGLSDLSGSHLGTVAARAALASCNVSPKEVEEVYMGCVLQAGMG